MAAEVIGQLREAGRWVDGNGHGTGEQHRDERREIGEARREHHGHGVARPDPELDEPGRGSHSLRPELSIGQELHPSRLVEETDVQAVRRLVGVPLEGFDQRVGRARRGCGTRGRPQRLPVEPQGGPPLGSPSGLQKVPWCLGAGEKLGGHGDSHGILDPLEQLDQLEAPDPEIVETAIEGHRQARGFRMDLAHQVVHHLQDSGNVLRPRCARLSSTGGGVGRRVGCHPPSLPIPGRRPKGLSALAGAAAMDPSRGSPIRDLGPFRLWTCWSRL